jgi:hypothetical protein
MAKKKAKGIQYVIHLAEMIRSPAWQVLSLTARRVLDLLESEYCRSAGKDNGKLVLTYEQLVERGIDRHAIAPAIRELVSLGFVEITQKGRGGNADFRRESRYRLTYLWRAPNVATHEWRKVQTMDEAEDLRDAARAEKQPQYTRPRKQKSGVGFSPSSVGETHTETSKFPVGETLTRPVGGTPTTI